MQLMVIHKNVFLVQLDVKNANMNIKTNLYNVCLVFLGVSLQLKKNVLNVGGQIKLSVVFLALLLVFVIVVYVDLLLKMVDAGTKIMDLVLHGH